MLNRIIIKAQCLVLKVGFESSRKLECSSLEST